MPIEFSCSQCSKQLRTPDETAGKRAKCPQCGAVMQIPYAAAFAPLPDFASQASPPAFSPLPADAPPTSPSAAPSSDPFNFNPYQSPTATAAAALKLTRANSRKPATRGTRLIGRMIDNLIYIAALIPGFVLLGMLTRDQPPGPGDDKLTFSEAIGLLVMLCGPLLVEILNCIFVVQSGKTLAKKMLGMRIVRLDGSLPGFVNGVILRSWVPGVIGLFFGGLFATANALTIFGKERRCIHDLLAGTRVVDD